MLLPAQTFAGALAVLQWVVLGETTWTREVPLASDGSSGSFHRLE